MKFTVKTCTLKKHSELIITEIHLHSCTLLVLLIQRLWNSRLLRIPLLCFAIFVCQGLVPVEQESGEEAETCSEDDKLQDLPPCWGLDIVCGKGTDFNYGPWADRQRWGSLKISIHQTFAKFLFASLWKVISIQCSQKHGAQTTSK